MSTEVPVLSSKPVRLTLPPLRAYRAPVRSATVKVPPRLSVPLFALIVPLLLQLVAFSASVPPLALAVPLLVKLWVWMSSAPAVVPIVPVLAKLLV
jgi:hypothetical protein